MAERAGTLQTAAARGHRLGKQSGVQARQAAQSFFRRSGPHAGIRRGGLLQLAKRRCAAAERAASAFNDKVQDLSARLHDFSDTAAFIGNLDLVITIDSSVAHLAGAMGKRVWLLNRYDTCWRWRWMLDAGAQ